MISHRLWFWLIFVLLLCSLLDWALIAALPRLGFSYGPVWLPVVMLCLIRMVILLAMAFALNLTPSAGRKTLIATLTGLVQGAIFVLVYYSFYIEPFHLTVTELYQPQAPTFLPHRPLRIVQLTDIHIEYLTRREQDLLAKVDAIQPDLIFLTGDYVNSSYTNAPRTLQETRQILSQLRAPYGIYAVNGNIDNPSVMSALFDGLANIRVLNGEVLPLPLPAGTLYLVGLTISDSRSRDVRVLQTLVTSLPPEAYSILLYHSPDLIKTAASTGVDLYFSGHTHGGQIRLPFYGAIATLSQYGKEYEMGEYTVGPTTLYVSRGIGMGGGLLPRARFLCPPELVLMELGE
jgi:predicted MPP superfamily phosphohydrolase